MQIPQLPDLRTALHWSRTNWYWIIAWIVLPTVVVLALMAWQRKKKSSNIAKIEQPTTDQPITDNQQPDG